MMIYENKSVTVKYEESVPCVIWTPLNFMKGDDWRTPFVKGIDFFIEKIKSQPELTWLNDARKLKTVPSDDLKWLHPNVNERIIELGLVKLAFVLPENIFGRMAVKYYVDQTNKKTDSNFEIKAFRKYEDAENWLRTKSEVGVEEIKIV